MNIYILDENPQISASCLCDEDVELMMEQVAQILACALSQYYDTEETLKYNNVKNEFHPCVMWTANSKGNYTWLSCHAIELCAQYLYRFGRMHIFTHDILSLVSHYDKLPQGDITPFVQAMPSEYKHITNPIKAYREYYIAERATKNWKKGAKIPRWMLN